MFCSQAVRCVSEVAPHQTQPRARNQKLHRWADHEVRHPSWEIIIIIVDSHVVLGVANVDVDAVLL